MLAWDTWLEDNWEAENAPYEFADLEERLLEVGGERVIKGVAFGPEIARLVEDGRAREPADNEPTMVELDASQCHFNAARLWMSKYDEGGGYGGEALGWNIVTGYALGPDDGIWREHTWLTDDMERLVETTVPRDMYYGVRLANHDEAKAFCAGEDVYPLSDE